MALEGVGANGSYKPRPPVATSLPTVKFVPGGADDRAMTGAPTPAPSPYNGGGGGYSAPPVQAPAPVAPPVQAPPPPAPVKDVDWFNSDSLYKGQAGRALADLTGQLAQILAGRDSGYQQIDMTRGDLARGRQEDLTSTGNDFAGRGLLSSGLFAQQADQVGADYSRQGEQVNAQESQVAQQYGKRGAQVDLSGLKGNDPSGLNSIYGLLGALGLGAGNQYNSQLGTARAESAARSSAPLLQTTTW